jgi:hypothetical protein
MSNYSNDVKNIKDNKLSTTEINQQHNNISGKKVKTDLPCIDLDSIEKLVAASSDEVVETDPDLLFKQLVRTKIEIALFENKKRQLLEEVHKQFLEGELDPRRRVKIEKKVKENDSTKIAYINNGSSNLSIGSSNPAEDV